MAAGPAPRRWSPASPGTRLVVFLLWQQPRGSSTGTAGWGAPRRGGKYRASLSAGDPTITNRAAGATKGLCRGRKSCRNHGHARPGIDAPGGHRFASTDPERRKKPPSSPKPPPLTPRTGRGDAGEEPNGADALNPSSTPLKTENKGKTGNPSAEPDSR